MATRSLPTRTTSSLLLTRGARMGKIMAKFLQESEGRPDDAIFTGQKFRFEAASGQHRVTRRSYSLDPPNVSRFMEAGTDFRTDTVFRRPLLDRKSTRLNSSHLGISYA